MNANIDLTVVDDEPRVDSRLIADQLGVEHESTRKIIEQYQADFDEFGVSRFEIAKPPKGSVGGRPEKFALLNEEQAYLLLTYSQNTAQARELKKRLVRAFSEYRKGASGARSTALLPVAPQYQIPLRKADYPVINTPRPFFPDNTINELFKIKADLNLVDEIWESPKAPGYLHQESVIVLAEVLVDDILNWRYPFSFAFHFDILCKAYLLVRLSDCFHHLSHAPHFKEVFERLTNRADKRIETELLNHGIIKKMVPVPTVDDTKLAHRISLSRLQELRGGAA